MTSLTNAQKNFFGQSINTEIVVSTVPKKDLIIVLPYLGKLALQIRTRIYQFQTNVFQTKCMLINFFTFKNKIPVFLRSGFVHKFERGGSNQN